MLPRQRWTVDSQSKRPRVSASPAAAPERSPISHIIHPPFRFASIPHHAATCANALTHLSRRVPLMRAGPFIGKSPSTTGRQEPFSPPEAVTDLLIALSLCQLWRPPP